MSKFREFMKAGHLPTLLLAFLYFDFCFAIWTMNGAMAPLIAKDPRMFDKSDVDIALTKAQLARDNAIKAHDKAMQDAAGDPDKVAALARAVKVTSAKVAKIEKILAKYAQAGVLDEELIRDADIAISDVKKGHALAMAIYSGALLRFPLGLLAQYIGRKNAALIEMGQIIIALGYGYLFVDTYAELLIMGVLLGIAGASFGVALSLGGGWYPPKYKGLAIGIAGAGNSGAIIASLFAPPLAIAHGWQNVYGYAIFLMLVPFILVLLFVKEPPDREKKTVGGYLKVLVEKDAWVFNISYILTFGGYIGFTMFLPTFFHDQYEIPAASVGYYSAIIIVMASISRILGGWIADRFGGLRVMITLCLAILIASVLASFLPPIVAVIFVLIVLFLSLGAGNGATFQLVPLRWTGSTAIAMSLIGEIGALGGSLIPNIMGYSKQYYATFSYGFLFWALLAGSILVMYLIVGHRWTKTWVGKYGKALTHEEYEHRVKEGLVPEPRKVASS